MPTPKISRVMRAHLEFSQPINHFASLGIPFGSSFKEGAEMFAEQFRRRDFLPDRIEEYLMPFVRT